MSGLPRARWLWEATLTWVLLIVAACDRPQAPLDTEPPGGLPGPATGVVAGTVSLEDADNPAGILVYAAGTNQVAFTDGQGRFTFLNLPFGPYDFMARKEGYSERSLAQVVLTPQAPTATLEPAALSRLPLDVINLPLPSRGALSGRLVLAGAPDSAGATVRLEGTSISTQTGPTGSWFLDEVVPGDYLVRFEAPGRGAITARATVLPNQTVEIPEAVLQTSAESGGGVPSGSGTIVGFVAMLGPDGSMVDDYGEVTVVLEGTERTAAPDAEGYFTFEGLTPERPVRLSARANGYRIAEVLTLAPRSGERVEATLFLESTEVDRPAVGSITGAVVLGDGESAAGAAVGVAGTSLTAVCDAAGRFTIEAVPEGTVTLIAQAGRYDVLQVPDIHVEADATTDAGTLTLTIHREPPRVITTSPAAGARNVIIAPQVPVFIRFSADMDIASVKSAVSLQPRVPFEAFMGREREDTDDDLLLLLIPGGHGGLRYRQRLEVSVEASARNAEGIAMREPFELRFTLGPPSLYDSLPDDGALGHPSDRTIQLYFNAPLRAEEIDPYFSFSPSPPTIPLVSASTDPNTGWTIVNLQVRLRPDESYRLRWSRSLRTASGQSLGGPREIRFRTAPQTVIDHHGQPVERDDSVIY